MRNGKSLKSKRLLSTIQFTRRRLDDRVQKRVLPRGKDKRSRSYSNVGKSLLPNTHRINKKRKEQDTEKEEKGARRGGKTYRDWIFLASRRFGSSEPRSSRRLTIPGRVSSSRFIYIILSRFVLLCTLKRSRFPTVVVFLFFILVDGGVLLWFPLQRTLRELEPKMKQRLIVVMENPRPRCKLFIENNMFSRMLFKYTFASFSNFYFRNARIYSQCYSFIWFQWTSKLYYNFNYRYDIFSHLLIVAIFRINILKDFSQWTRLLIVPFFNELS